MIIYEEHKQNIKNVMEELLHPKPKIACICDIAKIVKHDGDFSYQCECKGYIKRVDLEDIKESA